MHFKSGTAFPGPSQAQAWRLMPWLLRKLCTMPHSNYPNDVAFDFIKETVWRYDHLPEREFWKFGYDSSGFRKILEPSQNCFGMLSKIGCCRWFIPMNICESRQKLGSGSKCETDFHDGSCDRIKSASARTVSRS
jgi:hypothetical protein